ncbi:MAG: metalloregulator ArsR/SmtB family transcription factor [Chloroflexota bacterium]
MTQLQNPQVDSEHELLSIFKALADSSRLKIVGLLAQKPYTVEQLSALLNLKAPTISHHLSKLSEAGLVSAKTESYYSVYSLEKEVLTKNMQRLSSIEQMEIVTRDVDLDAFENKIIRDFSSPDGKLKTIPAQRKKLEAVLRHIVKSFLIDQRYSEKQVNEILGKFHEDTATLRRELVGYGLMNREGGGGEYWRNG